MNFFSLYSLQDVDRIPLTFTLHGDVSCAAAYKYFSLNTLIRQISISHAEKQMDGFFMLVLHNIKLWK